jgi:hypothetical protein
LGAEEARRSGDDGVPFPLAVGVERGPDPFRALDDTGPNTAFAEDENPKNAQSQRRENRSDEGHEVRP